MAKPQAFQGTQPPSGSKPKIFFANLHSRAVAMPVLAISCFPPGDT